MLGAVGTAAIFAAGAVSITLSLAIGPRDAVLSLRDVHLGMSEADVRRAFTDRREGRFDVVTGCSTPTIEWTRTSPGTTTEWARFEFHQGALVAIRMRAASSGATGSDVVVTPGAVRVQQSAGDGSSVVTILSRDCPTHHAEAEQWVAR